MFYNDFDTLNRKVHWTSHLSQNKRLRVYDQAQA